MGNWSDATLSTTTSIAKIETEINSLTNSTQADKIALAKEILGDEVELALMDSKYKDYIDLSDNEDYKDLVANPTVFNLSSDYMVLKLIFEDLCGGNEESNYFGKYKLYAKKFDLQFQKDMQRINISTDLDSTAEEYAKDITRFGRIIR